MTSQPTFRIRGTANTKPIDDVKAPEVTITSARRVVPGTSRDATPSQVEAAADEVVRVELENGFRLWTRADDLLRERGRKTVGRDGSDAWEIDARPPTPSRGGRRADGDARGSTRGWLGLGIKVLDFFGVDLAGNTAAKLGEVLESKLLKGNSPGLHLCSLEDPFKLSPLADDAPIAADQGPLLLFIHGTGSSCEGSFGKLWKTDSPACKEARGRLRERYGERAYALEHRSLTQSPIRNALDLAHRLPDDAELHVVTHSRGGLVGELLCLGERDAATDPLRDGLVTELFKADRTVAEQLGLNPLDAKAAAQRDAAYEADRQALLELRATLERKKLRVRRFVRVACPARGTTLASGRLDRWLSVLDFVSGEGLFGDGVDFLLAVVKERTDPRTLPGLEAMMPGSALTRLLQHPDLRTASDLSVIAGDIQGDSIWKQIKLLATDWFYGADHDLVVNTGSMYGGMRRPAKGARFQFDKGETVSHFNYFENDRSVRWLVAGLMRVDGQDAGFRPIGEAKHEAPKWREAVRRSRAATQPRPLAVVVPGAMGSALSADGERIWLEYGPLMRGGLRRIAAGAAGIEAPDVLGRFYGPLLEFLAGTHRVEVFPYDWRMSLRDAAARLAQRLEDWLPEAERHGQAVHLVGHSMGGLVLRAMIADGGRGTAVWRRIEALPNSRLMMLGTPNHGSFEAVRWLTGSNPTQLKLSLLDITQSTDEIVDIVRSYPGLLELLPFGPDADNFCRQGLWKELKEALRARWNPADEALLRQTRTTWSRLEKAAPDPARMVHVAGCQPVTVNAYQVADYDSPFLADRKRLMFMGTHEGDGTVTWKSGALPGVPNWYLDGTPHNRLCADKRAFPAYLELLRTGKTSRLPDSPPAGARAAAGEPESFPVPALPFTDDIPDEGAVGAMAFGADPAVEEDAAEPVAPAIQVSICHGNLAYARYPVLVGHYLGDTIVSAEAALDARLDGALSRRLRLGLYPGAVNTHAIFLNDKPERKPGGALVIGLGQVGELSPGLLEASVRAALLDYALTIAQWPDERFGPADSPRSAAVTCLLVGTGAGGIPVRDSVEAILRGAVAAARKLAEVELQSRVLIDRIEFLELWADVAIGAAEALGRALLDGQLADSVTWTPRVIGEGQGGRQRVRFEESPEWWQRLEIIEDEDRRLLRFIASTDRARAEESLATGQLRLAEAYIRQASQSPAANTEVAKTLFEMLLPNRLKELAPRQSDLVVLVDEASARYPWELLEDRWSQTGRPPAVAAGLVRQLKTPVYRPRPAHAFTATAFVVGNPDLDGWESFPDLPGARQEAEKVANLLRASSFEVRDSIDEKADAILAGLHRDAWRILHLAGHGEHEFRMPLPPQGASGGDPAAETSVGRRPGTAAVSGMVIGKHAFLTPGDVEQMRYVPELVFINCCHLGKTGGQRPRDYSPLAANLAIQFIRMGVRAVVAAGWAVDDAAAHTFAVSFYTHLLAGQPFGDAVRAAREETWKRFPDVNTWGAYQCYGDPSYRLREDGAGAHSRPREDYYAPSELVAELRNYSAGIRMQSRDKRDSEEALTALREAIGDFFMRVPESQRDAWLARADVAAEVGFAWGETSAWTEAIEWLDKSLKGDAGDCPVRAIEQRANFQVRLSGAQWSQLRDAPEDPDKLKGRQALIERIEQAILELDLICQRAPTVERLVLLGSACKRLASVRTEAAPRLEALVKMAADYREAFELKLKTGPDPYPFNNWAVARLLARHMDRSQGGDWEKTLCDELRDMAETARARYAEKPNLWDGTGQADSRLALLLVQHLGLDGRKPTPGETRAAAQQIVGIYRDAFRRGGSPREIASVREHLDFLTDQCSAWPKALRDAVDSIRNAL